MVYFDKLFEMYNIANTFQEQNIRSRFDDMGALQVDIEFIHIDKTNSPEKFSYAT